jgi:hypothetical protein
MEGLPDLYIVERGYTRLKYEGVVTHLNTVERAYNGFKCERGVTTK